MVALYGTEAEKKRILASLCAQYTVRGQRQAPPFCVERGLSVIAVKRKFRKDGGNAWKYSLHGADAEGRMAAEER